MRTIIICMILIAFPLSKVLSCDCECEDDCSFSVVSKNADLIALVKIISYDDFLEYKIDGYDKKMPYSMTVEIIKKYKGKESRKRVKIWGDNGAECRPYIAHFKIGEYFLIAPNLIGGNGKTIEKTTDYDFFICDTDYLKIDLTSNKAFGEYYKNQKVTDFDYIEKELKK